MSPVRVTIALLLGIGACRSNDTTTGSGDGIANDDGGVAFEGGLPPVPTIPDGYDGGLGIGLVDVPDTPCAPRGGALHTILAKDATPAGFRDLRHVGTRIVATATDGSGFLLADADGNGGSFVKTALVRGSADVLGDQVFFAGSTSTTGVGVQAYSSTGQPAAGVIALADEPRNEPVRIGVSGNAALVVWPTFNGMRARATNAMAPIAATYDLALTHKTSTASAAVTPAIAPDLFAAVFSGDDTGAGHLTAYARGSTTGRAQDPFALFVGPTARHVVGIARAKDAYAMLAGVDDVDGIGSYAMLVLLDPYGRLATAGLRLLGTTDGAAIAANDAGTEFGVVARRKDGDQNVLAFRTFDTKGAPLSGWVCLDAPSPEPDLGGAIGAQGQGYAIVMRAADGSTALALP